MVCQLIPENQREQGLSVNFSVKEGMGTKVDCEPVHKRHLFAIPSLVYLHLAQSVCSISMMCDSTHVLYLTNIAHN